MRSSWQWHWSCLPSALFSDRWLSWWDSLATGPRRSLVQSNPRPDLPLSARLQNDLKNDLIAGLLVVIPLATTIWLSTIVSKFVLAFVTSIPKQFNPFINLNPLLQDLINLALGLTVPLMGILLIGLMARNIVGRWLF